MRLNPTVLLFFFICIYLVPLGARPLFGPDEPRYGQMAEEIDQHGEWLRPRVIGLRYFEKPPLGTMINALSLRILGKTPFALRIPAALFTGFSAILILYLVSSVMGDSVALRASGIFLSMAQVLVIGTIAILDAPFAFFVTSSLVFFFLSWKEERRSYRWLYLILFGASCGIGCLIKGFLALVLPVIVIVPFSLWERRFFELFRLCWIPLGACLAIVIPVGLRIHSLEPNFWEFFIFNEHLRRFAADDAQHAKGTLYFIPVLIGGALPWTAAIFAVVFGLRKMPMNSLTRYALCWFVFPFLFFSLSKGKLATYILPCFPPLAILISVGVSQYLQESKKAFNSVISVVCVLFGIIFLAIACNDLWHLSQFQLYDTYFESWKIKAAALAGLLWIIGMILAVRVQDTENKFFWFTIAPIAFYGILPFILPNESIANKAQSLALEAYPVLKSPRTVLVAEQGIATPVGWVTGRTDIYLFMDPNEFGYGLAYPDASIRALPDKASLEKLILDQRKVGRQVIFVSRSRHWKKFETEVPIPQTIINDGSAVLAEY